MVANYLSRVRGLVLKYIYIPTGIKRERVRFDVYSNQKGHIVENFNNLHRCKNMIFKSRG